MNSPPDCLKYANERELFLWAAPRFAASKISAQVYRFLSATHFVFGTADKTIPLPSRIAKI